MIKLYKPLLVALAVSVSSASSFAGTITTLFNSNNGGNNGGAVYFDLTVGANAIDITGFETNTSATSVESGWSLYLLEGGSSFGSQSNAAAWTLATTGTVYGAGLNNASEVAINNIVSLSANTTYGVAMVMSSGIGHRYTNGTGANQSYANGELSLEFGSATNTPFGSGIFEPRVWNGSINYEIASVNEPTPIVLLGLGLAGLALVRRKKLAA